jgi:hypothetical protein
VYCGSQACRASCAGPNAKLGTVYCKSSCDCTASSCD